MKPETGGEATGKHPLDFPGCLGAARVDRSVKEPGKPYWEAKSQREAGKHNRECPEGDGEARSSEEAG